LNCHIRENNPSDSPIRVSISLSYVFVHNQNKARTRDSYVRLMKFYCFDRTHENKFPKSFK